MTSRPKQRTKHNNRETCVCESSQTLTSDFGFDFDVRLCVWHQILVWKYLIQKLCTAKRGTVFRSVILVGWLVILVTIPWTSYFKYNNYFCRTVYNYITVATSFFTTIIMIINPFSTGNIEKLDFWDITILQTLTTNAKFINLHTIRKLIAYSLKSVRVKAIFTFTVFEILLFKSMSILSLAQWGTGSERVKVSVKNQNNIRILLKWIEKWLTYKIQTFWIVFNFFWFCLTFSVSEKLKNSVFEIPVIPENLNTSKLRTTNTKSINLHTTEKLITYSLKNFCVKGMFAFTVFEILLFEYRLGWYYYLPPPSRTVQGAIGLIVLSF